MAQARQVLRRLKTQNPSRKFRLVLIKTTGDEFQSVELFKKTNVGVFTKAIEKKLLSKEVDIAVHSLKDLTTELPPGLRLAAFPKRLASEDVLITRKGFSLKTLPQGSRVGTGSPRRKSQLKNLRPDLRLIDMRGNLDTRVNQVLREKKLDAIVVAQAGILRLKKYGKYARPIPSEKMLPAVGQGALGIEIRKNDAETFKIVKKLNDAATEKIVTAERNFLKTLRGGCRVPVGIHSGIRKNKMYLKAAVFSVKTSDFLSGELSTPVQKYREAGKILAQQLLRKGAGKFLKEARARRNA